MNPHSKVNYKNAWRKLPLHLLFGESLNQYFSPLSFLPVRPSKPKCELEGEPMEGSDLALQCESSSGTEPIVYHWQRIREKEGEEERLPPKSRIGKSSFYQPIETTGQLSRNSKLDSNHHVTSNTLLHLFELSFSPINWDCLFVLKWIVKCKRH